MPWPTPQDYNEAIQNPRAGFLDPSLRAGTPELTTLGLPRPITGNFASVYRMHCGGRDWAVRCFFREYADMADRYRAISAHLATAKLPYTVGFQYQEQGIRVQGTWYPILKMEWVEGELLNSYIARNLQRPDLLRELAARWLRMLTALHRAGIAHGDLQHGNVLVTGNGLKLVDYDGMFVPALGGRVSHEIGHPNYQHPRRTGRHFSHTVDNFSATVIYLSLLGVGCEPSLWDEVGGGDECLLFRKPDFETPGRSKILSRLRELPDPHVPALVDRLEGAVAADPCDVPPIATATRRNRGKSSAAKPEATARASRPVPAWVLDALPPDRHAAFASTPERLRLLLWTMTLAGLGTLVLVLTMGLPLAAACSAALALDACLLGVSFATDGAVMARRRMTRERRRAARHIRALNRRLSDLARRREAVMHQHDSALLVRLTRRGRLVQREEEDRRIARAMASARIAGLDAGLYALDQLEQETLDGILRRIQERHIRRALRRHRLLWTRVSGVPWAIRWLLWSRGIRSAADVTARALMLQDLSAAQMSAVLRWHAHIAGAARASTPVRVPAYMAHPVRRDAVRRRRRLSAARTRSAEAGRRLEWAIASRYATRYARLDRRDAEADSRHALILRDLDERENAARAEEATWIRRLTEAERELERFEHIRFPRFVLAVLWPSSP